MFFAIMLTACALCVVVNAWLMLRAQRACDGAEHSSSRLITMRGRLTGLEGAVDALDRKHRKLAGRVYANEREERENAAYEEDDPPRRPVPGPEPDCENWLRSQVEGPSSDAAKCQCYICERKRRVRAELRAQSIPSTVQGQAALAKLNAGT